MSHNNNAHPRNTDFLNKLQSLQAHSKNAIEECEKNCSSLSDKLLDSKASSKLYWSILKAFLNNKKDKIRSSLVLTQRMCESLSTVINLRNLNPSKAHGQYMASIRMLKICNESICNLLGIIFRSCVENEKFPSE